MQRRFPIPAALAVLALASTACFREDPAPPEPAPPAPAESVDEAVERIRATAEAVVSEAVSRAAASARRAEALATNAFVHPYPLPGEGEFSVMSFNLNQYRLAIRDDDSEPTPKPKVEAASLVAVIRAVDPDILFVQEMGDDAAWAEFKYALRQAGLLYNDEEYLRRGRQDLNLALLSRFPVVSRDSHVDDHYTIGPTQLPVLRGVMDVTVEPAPGYRLRLIGCHLKSKVFHSFGQTEMRRAESRIVGGYVRDALAAGTNVNLLVLGDFNDGPDSLPVREITTYKRQPLLFDLRPVDYAGDAWTHATGDDLYQRIDYAFASPGLLPEVDLEKTYVVRSPLLAAASDHRPLVVTLHADDRPASEAPDLSARRPLAILEND
jgi:endonuclease/exonuclease/phosphatase family metal-dependent hydrolase